jgi:UDP-glucose 4-epimerase
MRSDKPVVLVTGANGFVGRHLVSALAREGWVVRRAVRQVSGAADEVNVGSIDSNTEWSAALADVQTVVHLAARVPHPREERERDLYRSVNTEGTLRLARFAAASGVIRFVHLSTVAVNGSTTDGRSPFTEKDEPAPRGVYGLSKAEAETGLQNIACDAAMKVTVVRPPLVYGPGAVGSFKQLVRAVELGIPLPLASVHNRRAFIGVQNLASFICNRLSFGDSRFEVFLVADREQISTPEFVNRIARAMGKPARLFPMPAVELMLHLMGRHRIRDSLIGSMELNISKALATGWLPQLTMGEGLKAALS